MFQGMLINRLQVLERYIFFLNQIWRGSFQRDAPLHESGQNLIGFAKWRVLVGSICHDLNPLVGAATMSLITPTINYLILSSLYQKGYHEYLSSFLGTITHSLSVIP